MSSYDIKGWNVVMFNNSTTKVPMIYVKPDVTFKEFVEKNSYAVVCEISGTGTIYDGKKIPGVVDKSCFVPNCRPNFCEKTGYYVVTLWANWYGYPDPKNLGQVKFFGLEKPVNVEDNSEKSKKRKNFSVKPEKKKGMNKWCIISTLGILSLILLVFIVFYRNSRTKTIIEE